jgi:membrane dipeptidase
MVIVDGHADLAWNMLSFGRDYTRSMREIRAQELASDTVEQVGQTLLGWNEWMEGRVALIFSTLFATPLRRKAGAWDVLCYAESEEATHLYREQLSATLRLTEDHPDQFRLVGDQQAMDGVLKTWEGETPIVGLVLLMEGADAVEDPASLATWFQAGVRILGPAWTATRYAGGTHEPGPLTAEGRDLLEAMADLGMILDISHLAEEAALEALDSYRGVLIASHSNARSLLSGCEAPDRHLSDQVIRRIAERGGVIGVVPYNPFLVAGWKRADGRARVTLDHVVSQVDHMCQLVGHARHVGIGSDFDGGHGLSKIPTGLDSVADLRLIGEALRMRGFSDKHIEAVNAGNWCRVLRSALPEN